jgi:Helix-turn-helix domain
MSIHVLNYVWRYSPSHGGNLLVLLAIADHADDDGYAYPSLNHLAFKARMTERGVQKCLKQLIKTNELKISYNAGPHGRNMFHVLMIEHLTLEEQTPEQSSPRTTVHPEPQFTPNDGQGEPAFTRGVNPSSPPPPEPQFTPINNHHLTKPSVEKEPPITTTPPTPSSDDEGETHTEPPTGELPKSTPKKKGGRQATPRCPFPPDYSPSESTIATIHEDYPGVDVPRLVKTMRDWALSKGEWKADWNATLRNFARKAYDELPRNGHHRMSDEVMLESLNALKTKCNMDICAQPRCPHGRYCAVHAECQKCAAENSQPTSHTEE